MEGTGETCTLEAISKPPLKYNASHHSKKEIMEEVHRVFGDDVPDDVDSVEFKRTVEEPYVEFKREGK